MEICGMNFTQFEHRLKCNLINEEQTVIINDLIDYIYDVRKYHELEIDNLEQENDGLENDISELEDQIHYLKGILCRYHHLIL